MARDFKDSGIEWIGQIPKEWKLATLKQIGTYINGYAFKPEDWTDSGKPIIRIQDLTGSMGSPNFYNGELDSKYLVSKGDILVSWAATLDAFIWEKEEGWLNQHIFKALPSSDVNYQFFYWLIKLAMENMNNDNKHGIVMQHVTTKVFGNFAVSIPSVNEQQKIADYLDKVCGEVDEMVALQETMIEELKAYKQSVITEAVTKGLNPDVPMKDSGIDWIGEVPEEWSVEKLKYLISKIESGVSVNAGNVPASKNEIGVLKTSCVSKYIFDANENKTVYSNEIGRVACPVRANTIIVSRMNTPELVGACGYVNEDYDNIYLPDRLWQVHFHDVCVKYIWFVLRSSHIRNYYSSLSVGSSSSMQNISQDQFANATIVLPPLSEQQSIASYLDTKCAQIDALIAIKQQKIDELKEYKKSVIYEYVTGKKEVV